jgi:hypothetical protein
MFHRSKSLVVQLPRILSTTLYIAQFITGAATVGLYSKQHGYWLDHGLPNLIVCCTPSSSRALPVNAFQSNQKTLGLRTRHGLPSHASLPLPPHLYIPPPQPRQTPSDSASRAEPRHHPRRNVPRRIHINGGGILPQLRVRRRPIRHEHARWAGLRGPRSAGPVGLPGQVGLDDGCAVGGSGGLCAFCAGRGCWGREGAGAER